MSPSPLEIWQSITSCFYHFQYFRVHKHTKTASKQQRQARIRLWTTIFKDESWTNTVLSHGLQPVIFGNLCMGDDPYLILVLAGDIIQAPNARHPDALLPSLRSQNLSVEHGEVAFPGFILNVGHILDSPPTRVINVPDPKQLFHYQLTGAYTSAICCNDTSGRIYNIPLKEPDGKLVVISLPAFKGENT
ncbi:hypothetical protein F4821DRAFT_251427 [Hypoxylon rubiginosum]|uniref:Uncharacterized protein n=1 Tax=Hypoxylon rubiginosum TaxID=110542 RepID=A0ACC0CJG6_9PEZI|nr:hypothetical protein F4821DRAFT_251427 [Hypoxylon rubiginosum]